jgi:hypothetical protein
VARPKGSKTGRRPPGGYPVVTPADGGFLAGFIEGEGSFNITKQARNTNHRCHMSLTVRDDDTELLALLASATGIGRIAQRSAYRNSRPQSCWTVVAKSDCMRLVELLTAHPLRGRKARDFSVWSAAVHWWIGKDVTRSQRRDWTTMRQLKIDLTAVRRYDVGPAVSDPVAGKHALTDWGPYFAGLLSAEGSLAIVRNGASFLPVVHITMRADDRQLLEAVRHHTGVGKLYEMRSKRWNPCVDWIVRDRPGLLKIVELLDLDPPRGRTASEYAVWRRSALSFASNMPRPAVRTELAELREELAAVREYTPA